MVRFIVVIFDILKKIYFSNLILLQLLGFSITTFFIYFGIDYNYIIFSYNNIPSTIGGMAYGIGTFLPFIFIVSAFTYSLIKKNKLLLRKTLYLFTASTFAVAITSLYKSITGRISPTCNSLSSEFYGCLSDTNFALNSFTFGWFENGIMWGYPSGHSIFAAAFFIFIFLAFFKNRTLKTLSLIFAIGIPVGVSIIGHWPSDSIAGFLVGLSIAIATYKVYKKYE